MATIDRRTFLAATGLAVAGGLNSSLASDGVKTRNAETDSADRRRLLKICDVISDPDFVDKGPPKNDGKYYNYQKAYAIRGLAVAYDVAGKPEYLKVCKQWSDRMLKDQRGMIPQGAYYMNYARRPGVDKGNWYVADGSSIALGVLATAARCDDRDERQMYFDSVKSFYRLVTDNWVRPSGGIANGFWPKSDKEYWCSTGIFGSLAFCLYKWTGDPEYLKVGRGTIDWLNRQNLSTIGGELFPVEEIKPTVLMYCLEAYSAGLPFIKPGSILHEPTWNQLEKTNRWIVENMKLSEKEKFLTHRGSKWAGMPFHLYVSSAHLPGKEKLVDASDRLLARVGEIIDATPTDIEVEAAQLRDFALMSYAEKVRPGGIYRIGKVV